MLSKFTLFKTPEKSENQLESALINNLKKLNISEESITKLLITIKKFPLSKQVYGALAYLTEYVDKPSICEQHYMHSAHIAEYYCTLTNIGFFAVGCYFQDYPTLAAAIFSTLSHAIPLKRLNELDKLAAIYVFLNVLYNYHLLESYPNILAAGALTVTTAILDKFVGRKHLETYGSLFHSMWHLSAAFTLFNVNQAKEMQSGLNNLTLN